MGLDTVFAHQEIVQVAISNSENKCKHTVSRLDVKKAELFSTAAPDIVFEHRG